MSVGAEPKNHKYGKAGPKTAYEAVCQSDSPPERLFVVAFGLMSILGFSPHPPRTIPRIVFTPVESHQPRRINLSRSILAPSMRNGSPTMRPAGKAMHPREEDDDSSGTPRSNRAALAQPFPGAGQS